MYCEMHIICRPPLHGQARFFREEKEKISILCKQHGWWWAELSHDEGDEEKAGDIILTSRDKTVMACTYKIESLYAEFTTNKLPMPIRYKIELCIMDSKIKDEINLLC